MTKFLIKAGMLACGAMVAAPMWAAGNASAAAAASAAGTPMVAPPPPRMLDEATAVVEGPGGTLSASQRQHCQGLLDQINALPGGPQWSTGKGSVTAADGRTYPTLERQADRKRLEEAYRQQCAQERR
ncbi:hypothetical protein [Cupriavidus alkaliphilus]|uniref:hypothetical protein n=1 Tax=Cupriavidus alkaliphilus TaxID=942866 RepID=UPI0015EB7762|nr:hypothetical protein [Cupriavidus alkaliphilus]MBB2919966.1 hypothetical protein [Cupriavidus alkaliphilus]MBB3013292.1 hypothetical protein [Cupriavidus alkaliphilus]